LEKSHFVLRKKVNNSREQNRKKLKIEATTSQRNIDEEPNKACTVRAVA